MLKITFRMMFLSLFITFLFLNQLQAKEAFITDKIDKEKLAEEWKEISKKYPNFALMYMHDMGMQLELINSLSAVRLEDKYEQYFKDWGERICQIGFLPKCPPAPCKDCSRVIEGELDHSEIIDYAECEIERRECESKTKLCCQ